jgi:hypothetical protein
VPRRLGRQSRHGLCGARDLTQLVVRERGMAAGWVDYKIASLDDTWSALRFGRRS